jgi:eukaryotic-like serine/threonine-protein kinase
VAGAKRIAIVADDPQVGSWLQHRVETLQLEGRIDIDNRQSFDQRLAATGIDGIDHVLSILDFRDEARDASNAWLDRMLGIPDFPSLIVIADQGDELAAVQCLHRGVADYLPRKQLNTELLKAALLPGDSPTRSGPRISSNRNLLRSRMLTPQLTQLKVPRDLIPRYMLLDTLGESTRASVYLAQSEALGRHVALKVSRVVESGEAQFTREYEAIGGIRHPSIVDIYDYGMHEGREFIAMEYFPCGDLKARLQNPMSTFEACDYLTRIAAALGVVHKQGILHRDLKPPNIMLREDAEIVLIDFGLAKSIENATRNTAAGVLRGSPYYMSPEQAQGQELDGRSDIYSLGVVFYEMLTGSKPYLGSTAVEVLQQHVSSPVPELPEEMRHYQPLLEGMLAKSRDDRFAKADDLLASMEKAAA